MTEPPHDLAGFDSQSAAATNQAVEVDPDALQRFLRAQPDVDDTAEVSDIRPLTDGTGASNGIVFFTFSSGKDAEPTELVLRYATETPLLKQKRFADEFHTMRAARDAGFPVPAVHWLDESGELLGRPSCITERARGEAPPSSLFTGGPFVQASPARRHDMMLSVAALHGRLKAAAIGPDRVPHLADRGSGYTAIEREFAWWIREAELANPAQDKLDFLDDGRHRMLARQPDIYAPALVHGDAQFANVMFDDGAISAVLDWELAYLGHNEADLALLVTFSETLNPADAPVDGVPTEDEYVAAFEAASGTPVEAFDYFKAFCLMKICVAMVLGSETMPGAEQLWEFYSDRYAQALDRI